MILLSVLIPLTVIALIAIIVARLCIVRRKNQKGNGKGGKSSENTTVRVLRTRELLQ